VIGRIWIEGEVKGEPVNERTDRPNTPPPTASADGAGTGSARRGPPPIICRTMRYSSRGTTRGTTCKHHAPGKVQSDAEVLMSVLDGASTGNVKRRGGVEAIPGGKIASKKPAG
jgi:hypothetical protein